MNLGIIIPLVLLPIAIVGAFAWYRRSMAQLRPDETKPVSGVRLTAEAFHRAPTPPWRVVYEIGGALGGVDHVLVGPSGVTAVTTVVGDRPDPEQMRGARSEAILVSEAAIARGPLDELLRAADASCQQWARIYWGTPDAERPPAETLAYGSVVVEGQRVDEWLGTQNSESSDALSPARVDLIWRTVVTGIGRPDPFP